MVKITLSTPMTGAAYFPGLAKARTLDLDQLPEPVAEQLRAAAQTLLAAQPAGSAPASRDPILHRVQIDDADGSRQVEGPPLGEMGKFVRAFQAALRSSSRSDLGSNPDAR